MRYNIPMISLPEEVTQFLSLFMKNNFQIYIVGGAVRDLLLVGKTNNWDFTTNATPEQILKLFPDGFYNNQFGTVGIETALGIFEVTTFRTEEKYTDLRHPEKVVWAKTLLEDLARRDFTINALAFDGTKIIDVYNGQTDLQSKIIRAVGDPEQRFKEDALRLMRAVRFATTLGFTIEDKTKDAVIEHSSLITNISSERMRDELLKIVASPHGAGGMLLLRETRLLKYILPELDSCFAVDQKSPERHHIDDVGTHLVKSLKHSPSTDVITRLATLLHDIGKVKTYRKDPTTEIITFYNHEVVGTHQVKEIADRLKLSKKQKDKLITLVRYHQFTVSELQTDRAVRRFIREVGKEYLQDMLDLRLADRLGSGAKPSSWRFDLFKKRLEEVQKEPFSVKDLKIDGNDVMKILTLQPGPRVGEILSAIFNDVIEDRIKNVREDLLKVITDYPPARLQE